MGIGCCGGGVDVAASCNGRETVCVEPLAEIAPEWVHPVLGVTVGELLARVECDS
jgi:7,8-dihydro-6-hydroxymethylpterin-pyrophosphokinase